MVISSLLATCSADQTCKIWRTSNFSLMTELSIKSNNPGETSRGWMWDCAFSGDSQYIVTGQYVSPGKWVIITIPSLSKQFCDDSWNPTLIQMLVTILK